MAEFGKNQEIDCGFELGLFLAFFLEIVKTDPVLA